METIQDGRRAEYNSDNHAMAGVRNAYRTRGSWSSAYAWTLTISGVPVGVDLILFRAGSYDGYLTYSGVGAPATAAVRAFAVAAAAKAEHGSPAPVPDTVSITSAPVLTAHTTLGAVSYRVIGGGPPLVLIMGYGGTMETWDPRLVNAWPSTSAW
jgi:pimeloyl-ACP methyl ester carboxylesterase